MNYQMSQALLNLLLEVANFVASRLENTVEKKAANALAMLQNELHFKPIEDAPIVPPTTNTDTPVDEAQPVKEGTE
jgi:hypothetical protein